MATTHGRSQSAHSHAERHFWTKESVIWSVQITLAIAVFFAGAGKLFASADSLDDSPFAPAFLRVIGSLEILGALGLILPGALRKFRWLTPLAALGIVAIMAGAVVTELSQGNWSVAITPLVLGLMAAYVAWTRRPWLTEAGSPIGRRETPLIS